MLLHTSNLKAEISNRLACIGTGFASLLLLNACSLFAPAPLDPIVGDTGQPLSANAAAYDVTTYALDLEVLPDRQWIEGSGTTELRALAELRVIELKLDSRFEVSRTEVDGVSVPFHRDGGVIRIELSAPLAAGGVAKATIYYSGRPHVAKNAPWDGGTVWAKTESGQPWVATAVQGEGCDLWWPCKDHFSDKPERVDMRITVPQGLSVALNGKLQSVEELSAGRTRFHWLLSVPASDYNISLNIGPFVRIEDHYAGINGSTVPIEFWALPGHEQKARDLINNDLRNQVAFYESVLGPFPWGGEKMGFVETPHLGMEHQTLNAYGKGYKRDENGFDWLLQHELAHEWFGNLMTHERLNDAWLHEGFGLYMQPAYARYRFGEAAYHASLYKSYLGLKNCAPVVLDGTPTSTEAFNSDIYGKGGWTLHTLRWLIGDEAFWRATRRLLYDTAEPWTLHYPIAPRYRNTEDFVRIASEEAVRDLRWLFDVYLRQAELPELVTERVANGLNLRWQVKDGKPFPMPVPVEVDGNLSVVQLANGQAFLPLPADAHVIVDPQMSVLRYLPIIGDCKENTAKSNARK